ncbi:bifunctional diguanylate cyclase/phosphodiesterase [Hartmannibacter diazotrophicus]|uniref:bifunctional diguanylate cyclase/phosphodiesterase n=1 Tax=Hartmannibacter diazotrophicus TaxID=1482074 RepID=UPI001FE62D89|nr:bifunctional diguanylate cyclase/phosphodiesterase [Hartmannibacter diazotrophicus]
MIRKVLLTAFGVILLTLITGHVVFSMRDAANRIDDNRAIAAAGAALNAFLDRLSGTVTDNAVWDDAYTAEHGDDAASWAYDNWGATSEDYALYDGVIVVAMGGDAISAYLKGKEFSPTDYFGPAFLTQVQQSLDHPDETVSRYYRTDGGPTLAVAQVIQPYKDGNDFKADKTLVLFKFLDNDAIARMAQDYELEDLGVSSEKVSGKLNLPLSASQDKDGFYLVWSSLEPGTKVFKLVAPALMFAVLLLVLFLFAIGATGAAEAKGLRKAAEAARHDATHDSLSGLLNRSGLINQLEQPAGNEDGKAVRVLHLLDLDGFKSVNDTWGHAVGDELIGKVAEKIRSAHPEIAHAARLGGDEFALIQEGGTAPEKIGLIVLDILSRPFSVEGKTVEIGASVGFAIEEEGMKPLELLRRADMALYRAKDLGRGRALGYTHEYDADREQATRLEQQLRLALARGEIRAAFQPLVSASSGRIQGVEALARWSGPDGNVSPEIFIPAAERAGLIAPLGEYMLRKSIQVVRDWNSLDLSVNVSPLQLCDPGFASVVRTILEEEAFEPTRLTLEVTEGVLISNPEQARRSITALKKIGVRFALDDFGCGYASIGTLREFGFDRMKIDRSLVWGIEDKQGGDELLRATISLAAALRIPVTAEGTETSSQLAFLQQAGCDQIQGYVVGRPMSAKELTARLLSMEEAA